MSFTGAVHTLPLRHTLVTVYQLKMVGCCPLPSNANKIYVLILFFFSPKVPIAWSLSLAGLCSWWCLPWQLLQQHATCCMQTFDLHDRAMGSLSHWCQDFTQGDIALKACHLIPGRSVMAMCIHCCTARHWNAYCIPVLVTWLHWPFLCGTNKRSMQYWLCWEEACMPYFHFLQ